MLIAIAVAAACSPRESDIRDTGARAVDSTAAGGRATADRCYQSDVSVLLGPNRGGTSEGKSPGHIWLHGFGADSGMVTLGDSAGSTIQGRWTRTVADSIALTAFDDFLRVEMRLHIDDERVSGSALATSDAALEPDSAGAMRNLRRTWQVEAVRLPCGARAAES